VTPIATATNTAGTPIEVGDGPYAIAAAVGTARRLAREALTGCPRAADLVQAVGPSLGPTAEL
jgi:hypothetical protein